MIPKETLVVMPVYNAKPFVKKAIYSIISQTFTDFQFLIINDGSTDGSGDEICSVKDDRIIVMDQTNRGLGSIINQAIQYAQKHKLKFLTRMDADDISLPNRLERQIDLLQRNPNAAACSANCYYINSMTEEIIGKSTVSNSPRLIRWEINHGLRGLIHGASIFRVDALNQIDGYRPVFQHAEDVDLFLRLSERYDMINSKDFLYKIRLTPKSLSMSDVHQSVLYQFYALNCAIQRRKGVGEQDFDVYKRNYNFLNRYKIWREEKFLELWRKGLVNHHPLYIFWAALVDLRRPFVRVLRQCPVNPLDHSS